MKKEMATMPEEITERWKPPEEEIVTQFGVTDNDGRVYRAVRDFYLETIYGPLSAIKTNTLVRLSPKMADQLFFSGKVEPLIVGKTFQALRAFRTIAKNGEWLDVGVGDIVSMERKEAIEALRNGSVKEVKE